MGPEKIQRISVKALIRKGDVVLLVQDHKGKWEMPGGKIDFGERPEDALCRELEEELGFTRVIIKDIVNAWTFFVESDGVEYQFIVLVYEVISEDEEVKKSDEHMHHEWVSIVEIDSLNMRDGYKESIRKFFSGVNE